MFRKVSKKPKVVKATSLRRPLDDNENDQVNGQMEEKEEEEEDVSIQERIQETQKKHKLLASLPIASGDARPKKRRFLASATIEEGNEEDTNDLTVLALKHKQAMDEYIRGKLNTSDTATQQYDGEQEEQESNSTSNIDPEKLLYLELAAAAVPSKVLAQENEDDAKGAAILVGGTGIAEVILPKTTKFDNPTPAGVRYSRNPNVSSAVSNFKDQVGMENNLLPAGFRSMVPDKVSHEETLPPVPTTTSATNTLRPSSVNSTNATTPLDSSSIDAPSVDDSRPGFAALVHHKDKGRTTMRSGSSSTNAPSSKPRGHQYEKDRQAFSKFVKRQRESGGHR